MTENRDLASKVIRNTVRIKGNAPQQFQEFNVLDLVSVERLLCQTVFFEYRIDRNPDLRSPTVSES